MEVLQYDKAADVRRKALAVIDVDDETIPFILERATDIDPQVRVMVYRKVKEDFPDVTSMSIEVRNLLLASGLTDRFVEK